MTSINPATGETLDQYAETSPADVTDAITGAHKAFLDWRDSPFSQRADFLRRAAVLLRECTMDLGRLMASEMGKPVPQGIAEIEKCALACEHYATHAEDYLAPLPIPTEATRSVVLHQPLGVILAIMPWNFPFWQVFRFVAPALMAGNAALLKHASNVPGCALAIEDIIRDAGFPPGLLRTLLVPGSRVEPIIQHPLVRAVTLTGSTPAGQTVARQAGALLKKTVLELGGSDPYLILEDADLDHAAATCVQSRLLNTGQSCIAAKRFIVLPQVLAPFTEKFVALMRAKTVGDPLAPADPVQNAPDLGPLARTDLRNDLHQQVRQSVERGARLLLGGQIPAGPGAFYPPTVLANVTPGMPAYDEELFGPAAAIIPARDEADAIRIANDTHFGLGSAIFTRDLARAERIATRLEAGQTFVNSLVASDPRLPFGGIKSSGYGRELGPHGIKEFVNVKTLYMQEVSNGK